MSELRINADSGAIKFGADYDIELTHNADKGLILKHTATADDKPVILTLQTGETDMAANDVMGKIEFQAPDEGTGTDAILVAAGIQAVSEGDFSSSSNATRLEFMTGSSEAATSQMTISSGGIVGIGAGVPGDLGIGLHIKEGDSGSSSVDAHANQLVIEHGTSGEGCGINFLAATDGFVRLAFGDSDDDNIGQILYNNTGNIMAFFTNTSEQLRINDNGCVLLGDTATEHSDGLVINQGANDTMILSLKSSDVAHGMTGSCETDTYAHFGKQSATKGGMAIRVFSEDLTSERLNINIQGEGDLSETKSTSAKGGITFGSSAKSGTGQGSSNSDGIIMSIANYTTTCFLFEGDGNFHADAGSNTYDAYEDAQLARAYDLSHGKGVIESKFDKFVAYNHEKLAQLDLVGREEDGTPNHFINVTGMQRLHNGAIWQQYEKHQRLANAVFELAKVAVGEEKANEILEENDIKLLN